MLSEEYQCIFIEVPKTGSTSIRNVLNGIQVKPHLDILETASILEKEIFDHYYKFGFVRNPWDRTVSLYHRNEGIQMKERMTFKEFVFWIQKSSNTCIHPSPKQNQLDWFTNENGKILVDFIGKFENIEEDWRYVQKKIDNHENLPKKNSNPNKPKKHYSEFYDKESREMIAKKFRVDIEYFGYSF